MKTFLFHLTYSSENNNKQTSLHLAILKKKFNLVKYLISLPNINVCTRDRFGYTPLGYLCEQVAHSSTDDLELVFKLINRIADRCPQEQLFENFHRLFDNKINENLLLHAYEKLTNLQTPNRFESIIIGTDQDRYLYAEQLLASHSWNSAILALCNTDNVNISKILNELITYDQHDLLIKQNPFSSNSLMVFISVFYGLATDIRLIQKIVPICQYTTTEIIDANQNSVNTFELIVISSISISVFFVY